MKACVECIPCILRQIIQASRFSGLNENDMREVVREAMNILLNEDWNKTPPELAHVAHKVVRDRINGDPYAKVKKMSNDMAMRIYPRLKRRVGESGNKLRYAIKLATAGNIIDFGAFHTFSLEKLEDMIDDITGREFRYDSHNLFLRKLEKSRRVLYFLDNAGEIVFDRVLVETLLDEYNLKFDFVVKAGPIINDATIEDLRYVGLDEFAENVLFISNGEVGYERNHPEVGRWIEEHDLTISKGQGNYEGLSEWEGVFYILMVKCNVVARDLNAKVGDMVFLYR